MDFKYRRWVFYLHWQTRERNNFPPKLTALYFVAMKKFSFYRLGLKHVMSHSFCRGEKKLNK